MDEEGPVQYIITSVISIEGCTSLPVVLHCTLFIQLWKFCCEILRLLWYLSYSYLKKNRILHQVCFALMDTWNFMIPLGLKLRQTDERRVHDLLSFGCHVMSVLLFDLSLWHILPKLHIAWIFYLWFLKCKLSTLHKINFAPVFSL